MIWGQGKLFQNKMKRRSNAQNDLFPQLDKVKDEIEREISAETLKNSNAAVSVSRLV